MEILMSGFERLERERPAAPRRHTPPPRDPARDDHAAATHVADPHTLNMWAEQVRRQIVKERARAAGEPEPTFGPLSEAPDLYSPGARLQRLRRQMERDRAARQAAQGEPAPAPVSLPPTSTLARPLQEGPGTATAATLMRQFAAERATHAAEADAPPASIIPLHHRAVATDEAAGPVAPVEAAAATPLRQDEEHGAHGAEAVPAPLPLIPAPHADAQAPHTGTLPPLVPPAAAPVPTVPDPALHAAPTLHLAPYGAATPSGLAPLVIPSTSQQIETLRARGAGVPLDPALARAMAGGLGVDAADLAPIRLHHDPGAWALAARFGQPVYAEGNDVFFQKGAYQPGRPQGRNLLGRQLARTPAVIQAARRLHTAENAPAPHPRSPPQPQPCTCPRPCTPPSLPLRTSRTAGMRVRRSAPSGMPYPLCPLWATRSSRNCSATTLWPSARSRAPTTPRWPQPSCAWSPPARRATCQRCAPTVASPSSWPP